MNGMCPSGGTFIWGGLGLLGLLILPGYAKLLGAGLVAVGVMNMDPAAGGGGLSIADGMVKLMGLSGFVLPGFDCCLDIINFKMLGAQHVYPRHSQVQLVDLTNTAAQLANVSVLGKWLSHLASLTARASKPNGPLVLCLTGGNG